MRKKFIYGIVVAVLMLSIFALSGCNWLDNYEREPRYIDSGAWQFRRVSGGIAVVRVLDVNQVICENRIMVIPTEINGYPVVQLGDVSARTIHQERTFHVGQERINRIVVPESIFVEVVFWRGLHLSSYVEFLASEPNFAVDWTSGNFVAGTVFIVPDGSIGRYLEHLGWTSAGTNIRERSEIAS